MVTWHVYQFRSDTELLYVGYSRRLKNRLSQHRRTKSWWAEVTDVSSEEFATEDAARQREKEIWATERPKYNKLNPFVTPEEEREREARQEREWAAAHREACRESCRRWYARNAKAKRAYAREYHNRPEVRARERERWMRLRGVPRRPKRGQQEGPGLF